ncbi:MAG TPA: gliding motility lipoprotein GldH [Chitinophagales bacterium]|nr:gliding motility lipoprotein GldH [Chitinophagales bacterium]
MMKKSSYFFCCILIVSLLLSACDKTRVMEENQQITAYNWDYADGKTFTVDVTDTTQHYNVFVNVRHSFQFDWRNLWVKIKTTFPDGKNFEKRVNIVLSGPDGHWYASCLGDNCDYQAPIQMNAIFPEKGKYSFTIEQDMRVNPLPKIKSIGMRVEKAQ